MLNIRRQHTILALAVALLANPVAQAQSSIFVKYETLGGPPISGLQGITGFENSILASSFQFGVGTNISNGIGVLREASAPNFSNAVWTYPVDSTYNQLSMGALAGGRYNSTFSFVNQVAGNPAGSYLTMNTGTTAISGLSISSGGDRPSASVEQSFRSFNLTYDPSKLGLRGNATSAGYDSVTGVASGSLSRLEKATGAGGPANGLYLRLGSGSSAIHGDSNDTGYENWIKLNSFQMGLGIGLSPDRDGFTAPLPSISEVTLSQSLDGSSMPMLANLLRGRAIGQATLELVSGGANGGLTTMQLELDNVMISGMSFSSGGDQPSVSESLNFTGYKQTLWDIQRDGTRGRASSFHYDILTGELIRDTEPAASVEGFGSGNLGGALAASASLPPAAPVPEPQVWAMMAGGLALLGWRRRRSQG